MTKKNILFYITDLGGGGAEKILVEILNNLSVESYNINLFLFDKSGINLNFIPKTVKLYFFVSFSNLKFGKYFKHFIKKISFRFLMLFPQIFYKCFIKNNYDTEVCFIQDMTYLLNSGKNKSYKIAWIHTNIENSPTFKSGLYKNLLHADKIICVSNGVKDILLKYYPSFNSRTKVIYNIFNIADIINKSNKFKVEGTNIISVGRLDKMKGFYELINAFAILKSRGYPWKLCILGSGPELDNLIALTCELNIAESVSFLGYQENPFPYIKAADLFVLSSNSEGFGNVLVEALALSKPIVATDCPTGPAEILGDGKYGYLVPVGDLEKLVNGIEKVMTDVELRNNYINLAYSRAYEFDVSNIMPQIEDLLKLHKNT